MPGGLCPIVTILRVVALQKANIVTFGHSATAPPQQSVYTTHPGRRSTSFDQGEASVLPVGGLALTDFRVGGGERDPAPYERSAAGPEICYPLGADGENGPTQPQHKPHTTSQPRPVVIFPPPRPPPLLTFAFDLRL